MNIVVIGSERDVQECSAKFEADHQVIAIKDWTKSNEVDHVVFIFDHQLALPKEINNAIAIFVNTSCCTLLELAQNNFRNVTAPLFGFAGFPGFLNRPIIEVCSTASADLAGLGKICEQLRTAYQIVSDRIGMFTPRVIAMIINEAYFAAEDKTASRNDIDKAMKTGTNYPWGPFEWSRKIGLKNIVDLLVALGEHDPSGRYQICDMLKSESLAEHHE